MRFLLVCARSFSCATFLHYDNSNDVHMVASEVFTELCDTVCVIRQGSVDTVEDVVQNEQLAVRNMLTKTESGDFLVAGNPIKVRAAATPTHKPPGFSSHDILVRVCTFSFLA